MLSAAENFNVLKRLFSPKIVNNLLTEAHNSRRHDMASFTLLVDSQTSARRFMIVILVSWARVARDLIRINGRARRPRACPLSASQRNLRVPTSPETSRGRAKPVDSGVHDSGAHDTQSTEFTIPLLDHNLRSSRFRNSRFHDSNRSGARDFRNALIVGPRDPDLGAATWASPFEGRTESLSSPNC